MQTDESLSIIIPTRGAAEDLIRCLSCIDRPELRLAEQNFEIIVSSDGDARQLELLLRESHPAVQVCQGPGRGPAANRNAGAARASGRWLVFTDDDCLPDPGWLSALLEAIRQVPDSRVFEGRVYADRVPDRFDLSAPVNETGGLLWSCNMAIRRDLFHEMGGFDERFPYAAMEDVDLRFRLKKRGISAQFLPGASVCHPLRFTTFSRIWQHTRSLKLYLKIHPEERLWITECWLIRAMARTWIYRVLPHVIQYRCRGLLTVMYECSLQAGLIVWLISQRFCLRIRSDQNECV